MLGLRSAVSEISKNTIFEHGGCLFLMLGLRSAVCEISENTIFEFFLLGLRSAVCEISENTIFYGGWFFLNAWSEISCV